MPYIPHTETDVQQMLATIGVESIDDLFDEIPEKLRIDGLHEVPEGLNEMDVSRLLQARAAQDTPLLCFAGGGAYEHHIPAPVWEITARGEFYSAYTPYQAEASQGTLQLIYEYQSMMAALMDMDASNASLYEGASALAEAVLMAVRAHRRSKSKRILMPKSVHPVYRKVVETIVTGQGVQIESLGYNPATGCIDQSQLQSFEGQDITALVIPQPNYFGVVEDVDALTDWAMANSMLTIALVNPLSMALLKPPGQWGGEQQGADIACGEGQSLGIPLSSGGPYYGFMCCKQQYVRQMPGRIVGMTEDVEGQRGFALTLQAREQHIRRSKATSNICTNQGLMVTASTIHMSLMGAHGLKNTALVCHKNLQEFRKQLLAIDGVDCVFDSHHFHEMVIRLSKPVQSVLDGFEKESILGGVSLVTHFPELGEALLVCTTEMRNQDDRQRYCDTLEKLLRG